jgi:aspartyl-tRNA(Asn)/glutamyl-tRNA(Gln) amidotransferase subunit A
MLPEAIAFLSIRELAAKLRCREFTAVQLAEFFLDRLQRIGPKLNAVVTVTRDLALRQAKEADEELAAGKDRGLLHGIPYGAKDLLAAKGYPTSWGAAPFKEQMLDLDATVIVRLREAGAVLAAKLAMVEIAGGLGYVQANASFSGPGLNPWDTKRWSGGSSTGPGSAVGGGLVPFAIGSETWGSIMTPAGFCGLAGLRPTYGRVSRHGAMALSWSLDKLGPMCRTADDCGLVLHAIAGSDPLDPTASDRKYAYAACELKGDNFKLGVLKERADNAQPEVKQNFEASLEVLKQFATISEFTLPDLPWNEVTATILNCEAAAAFEGLITTGDIWEMTAQEDHWGIHSQMVIPAKDYINALRIRPKLQRALDAALAPFDAIVTPTLATVAYPNDVPWPEYRKAFRTETLGGPANGCGLPALSVPNGFGEGGLPTGLQFVGRAFDENVLLALGTRYQQLTDWHTKHPAGLS